MSGEGGHGCQGTPDTAVSPDPPRTTSEPSAAPAGARSDGPLEKRQVEAAGKVSEFFTALGPRWALTTRQRSRLAPAVAAAQLAGWSPTGLAEFAGANTAGVRSPYAVLAARLSPGELPAPPGKPPPTPPWCGHCNRATRRLEHADGADAGRCPRCNPLTGGGTGAIGG